MYKTAVLGDRDSISGFAALGLEIHPADDTAKAAEIFKKLTAGEYAVVFITESLAEELAADIERCMEKTLPSIVLIPGITGNTGAGARNVGKTVEKAVGSDIIN